MAKRHTIWVNYRDEFSLLVSPITPKEMEKLAKDHRKLDFDPKSHRREYKLNEKTYYPALVERIVHDWKGLTEKTRRIICYEDIVKGDPDMDKIIPFDGKECAKMMRSNYKFSEFVQDSAMYFEDLYAAQIEAEQELEKEETKNSSTGGSTSSELRN